MRNNRSLRINEDSVPTQAADPHVIPIPGAKNAQQAAGNAGALGWHPTEAERARISQVEAETR